MLQYIDKPYYIGHFQKVTYSNGLRGEVAFSDHEVSSVIKFDNGPSISLNFCFKGLMFL